MTDIEQSSEGELEPQGGGRFMAALEANDLRSIFHLLVGKPDSTQQMFRRRVHVGVDSIRDLHERMSEKLANHRTEGVIATADVSFEDKSSVEFGTWAEFEQHRWTGPKVTKEVRLRWEFLVAVDGYKIPQRHTVTVKLSPHLKPFDLMRAVFSKDPSEVDTIEIDHVPILCRVDFVNHVLSKELIAVVDEWVHALPQPQVANSWFKWFEVHDEGFTAAIRYSAPLLAGLAAFMSLGLVFPEAENITDTLSKADALLLARWALASVMLLYAVDRGSNAIARKVYEAIQKYGNFTMFQLTNGDSISAQKLAARNTKLMRNFLINSGIALALNVAAGVIVYYGWPAA